MVRECKKCILDQTVAELQLTKGVCNYCLEHEFLIQNYTFSEEESERNLKKMFLDIKKDSKDSKYDCILGMSGGVDSSYVAHIAGELGLKVLVVHVDNSWNTETSVKNIKNIVSTLDFDLYTQVLNWEEFKDLQRSFFYASVLDIEVAADNAINAILWNQVKKNKIKHVLSGGNFRTEHGLPRSWRWDKIDKRNLKDIHKKFGTKKITSYPIMGNLELVLKFRFLKKIKQHLPLNKINFTRKDAVSLLSEKYGWQDYGGKHFESLFTKFYQAYVLPEKFGIDKRKAHLSSLIRNNEMTRDQAKEIIKKPIYTESELRMDKSYVLKKLGFSEDEFKFIMSSKPVSHSFYKNESKIKELINTSKKYLS